MGRSILQRHILGSLALGCELFPSSNAWREWVCLKCFLCPLYLSFGAWCESARQQRNKSTETPNAAAAVELLSVELLRPSSATLEDEEETETEGEGETEGETDRHKDGRRIEGRYVDKMVGGQIYNDRCHQLPGAAEAACMRLLLF